MTNTPKCEQCGTTLTRRRTEGTERFQRRRYCSRACVAAARRKWHTRRNCEQCNTPLTNVQMRNKQRFCSPECYALSLRGVTSVPYPGCDWCNNPTRFRTARYCSRACLISARLAEFPRKPCVVCGTLMPRRWMPRGKWENRVEYGRRVACRPVCPPARRLVVAVLHEAGVPLGASEIARRVSVRAGFPVSATQRAVFRLAESGVLVKVSGSRYEVAA